MNQRTVMQAFEDTASKHGSRPALRVKRGGSWQTTTWQQYRAQVRQAARALIHLGMQPRTGVSLIGYNCPEWVVADLAAIYAGGFPAGIYTTSSPEQCQYIAEHSDSSIVFVENAEQLAKFKHIRSNLPKLSAVVMMTGDDDADWVYSWNAFMQLGDQVSESALEARIQAQNPEDVCTLIYTSGTTGNPKAVMITHDNITWNVKATFDLVGHAPEERLLSYLPLSHIAEQGLSIHGPIYVAGCTYFAESLDQLGNNLKEVRPTLFLGVPRVWEKIQSRIEEAGKANRGLKKKLGRWARGVGLASARADQCGEARPLLSPLADQLVFSKVRESLGLDDCRLVLSSAAPIARSTLEFFHSLGVTIVEAYGMSECTGTATFSLPSRYKTGTVGWVLPGTELRIAADGEICMRGRHVSKGYYKNEAATAETFDEDGWLHSGDIGELDGEGFLRITDRKKDILITAGGENIAPQLIEGHLKSIDCVSQAVVVGDRMKHLSALLTLDETLLARTAAEAGSPATTLEQAAECPHMNAHLLSKVEGINRSLARVQSIKKIAILPRDLSIEGGELTPTMKVKRKVVSEKYHAVIDALYD